VARSDGAFLVLTFETPTAPMSSNLSVTERIVLRAWCNFRSPAS
jgi:hypothetical protein